MRNLPIPVRYHQISVVGGCSDDLDLDMDRSGAMSEVKCEATATQLIAARHSLDKRKGKGEINSS